VLENLLKTLGATPTKFELRTGVCAARCGHQRRGGPAAVPKSMLSATEGGAEVIAVTCPLCLTNLELPGPGQFHVRHQIQYSRCCTSPQLMGMAFGLTDKQVA